jgi:hypothetical protein
MQMQYSSMALENMEVFLAMLVQDSTCSKLVLRVRSQYSSVEPWPHLLVLSLPKELIGLTVKSHHHQQRRLRRSGYRLFYRKHTSAPPTKNDWTPCSLVCQLGKILLTQAAHPFGHPPHRGVRPLGSCYKRGHERISLAASVATTSLVATIGLGSAAWTTAGATLLA